MSTTETITLYNSGNGNAFFKFILNNKLELREDFSPPPTNKRYMIAKVNNVSEFFPEKEDEKYRAAMTQSYLNF